MAPESKPTRMLRNSLGFSLILSLCIACGGGGSNRSPSPSVFRILGQVTGLTAGQSATVALSNLEIVLRENGEQILLQDQANGTTYSVNLVDTSSSIRCSLTNASGVIESGNAVINIDCVPAPDVSIGGNVIGLVTGDFVELNLGTENLRVVDNGRFTFSNSLSENEFYDITIRAQSAFTSCSITFGSGTAIEPSVTSPNIQCDSKVLTPTLVKDFNTEFVDNGSEISSILSYRGGALFVGGTERELWFTDGTANGTVLLGDIFPGTQSSYPRNLLEVDGLVYFTAEVSQDTFRLWRTDGTINGTTQIANIDVVPTAPLRKFGDQLLFISPDSIQGGKIWISDGSSTGTRQLSNLAPDHTLTQDSTFSFASEVVNGLAIFAARPGPTGNLLPHEVWATDGSDAGTVQLTNLATNFNSQHTSMDGFTFYNGFVYFWFSDRQNASATSLWKTDGSIAGTQEVANYTLEGTGGHILGVSDGSLFYVTPSDNLLRFDGSTLAINAPGASQPTNLVSTPQGTYFKSNNLAQQTLWRIESASASATAIFSADAKQIDVLPWAYNDRLVYTYDGDLWQVNGSVSSQLFDTTEPSRSTALVNLGPPGAKLFFAAEDTQYGNELRSTNGTPQGTELVANLVAETKTGSSYPRILGEVASGLVLHTRDAPIGGVWITDGSSVGSQFQPISATQVRNLHLLGSSVFFVENSETRDTRLLSFSLNDNVKTELLSYSFSGDAQTYDSNPQLIYIPSSTDVPRGIFGNTPYLTDQTMAGTQLLSDVVGSPPITTWAAPLTANGSMFIPILVEGSYGLYRFDRQGEALTLIANVFPNVNFPNPQFTINENGILFTQPYQDGTELWSFDSSGQNLELLVKRIENLASSTQYFSALGVTFFAKGGPQGEEPWITDGTRQGTQLLLDINRPESDSSQDPALLDSSPRNFADGGNGFVYFSTQNPENTLWETDGSTLGTRQLNIQNVAFSNPRSPSSEDGLLYFVAEDQQGEARLWVSDTMTETRLVSTKLKIGQPGIYKVGVGPAQGLYLSADDGLTGVELYKLNH